MIVIIQGEQEWLHSRYEELQAEALAADQRVGWPWASSWNLSPFTITIAITIDFAVAINIIIVLAISIIFIWQPGLAGGRYAPMSGFWQFPCNKIPKCKKVKKSFEIMD